MKVISSHNFCREQESGHVTGFPEKLASAKAGRRQMKFAVCSEGTTALNH
jgi:hypothetical protein